MSAATVSIGCSSAFWGDSAFAAAQLLRHDRLDYLVSDYLAEITMSLLARAREKSPQAGYPPDFIEAVAPLLPQIKRRGVRIVSNAGGMNPRACRAALQAAASAAGIALRVAVVEGDDLMPRLDDVQSLAPVEMSSGVPMPRKLASCNAYLGARPIAAALDLGADVVLTGRCVDSALVLGILMHEFGWRDDDYDRLAAGSLAGHVIECGPQCTGGLFTDWQDVPGWDDMGYPIVECSPDGAFIVTKPEGTGGLVSVGTVAEQVVYEIGDPGAYLLPDVACDFRDVRLEVVGRDRVRVTGARGRAPSTSYKACATYADGWRLLATLMLGGRDAAPRARRMGEAIVARCDALNRAAGRAAFREALLEVIGAEDTYGDSEVRNRELALHAREVILKVGLRHDDKAALELFGREMMQAGVAMAQGTTGAFGGRPVPSPVIRLFSFLLPKSRVPVAIDIDGARQAVPIAPGRDAAAAEVAATEATTASAAPSPSFPAAEPMIEVPLIRLAWGRSGDKGNDANIGIVARQPRYVAALRESLTPPRIAAFFAHYRPASVTRWELPGFHAFNFLLKDVLGGGGIASLRYDPQGKAYAQMLMDLPVRIPARWLDEDAR